jgi:hyperosmotically inducible periplasmic protein
LKTACLFAVALALAACGRQEPPQPPQPRIDEARQAEKADATRKPLSDSSLAEIVKSALLSESGLDARKIDVENRSGNVALYGAVETEEQKERAGRIVAGVAGVKTVDNKLSVK